MSETSKKKREFGFQPGISGNPRGRPVGSNGLMKCRNMVKKLLKKPSNQRQIEDMLQDYLDNEPRDFYREFIREPKGGKMSLEVEGEAMRPISVNIMPKKEEK